METLSPNFTPYNFNTQLFWHWNSGISSPDIQKKGFDWSVTIPRAVS